MKVEHARSPVTQPNLPCEHRAEYVSADTLQKSSTSSARAGHRSGPTLALPADVQARQAAVGKPGGRVAIENGEFIVNGCCLWNPTMWPLVTLCFGSWVASLPSQSTR